MEQQKRGGKRLGAGRKPSLLKKKIVSLYVEQISIYKFGDENKMKSELYDFIKKYNETNIQDLTKPTNQIKPQEQQKTNYPINTIPQPTQEALYIAELDTAKTIQQVKGILSLIEKDNTISPQSKMRIKIYGIKLTEKMYND